MKFASRYSKYWPSGFIALVYFVVSLLTLSHYGINWDEPLHFNRGQAYLHYFLTGRKNYLDLPQYPVLRGSSDYMGRAGEQDIFLNAKKSAILPSPSFRRSYFQSDVLDYSFFIKSDGRGHPPVSDILAAGFNHLFYQKLGILGDIEAYHLYEIVTVTLLVIGVGIFTCFNFGIFASIIATLSLALYPLVFSESHFNIKDPPEMAFFGLAIIFFYFGIIGGKWKKIFLAAIFIGLALGTKFNIVFLPLVILPWFTVYLIQTRFKLLRKKLLVISLFALPLVVIAIYYAFWPKLWLDPVGSLIGVIKYYLTQGTTPAEVLKPYIFGKFNLFAAFWVIITTPLVILIFGVLGSVVALDRLVRDKKSALLLVLLWLLVPIARVSLAGTALSGGVRQIMEFIPALAILAGVGATWLYPKIKNKYLKCSFYFLIFYFLFSPLWRYHPNENVYFNEIIGGLRGAKAKNIPFWGYSYGNVYLQGVNWLNENAPAGAKLALPIVNMVNVPRLKLRPDIDFSNEYLSAGAFGGEYIMEMSHNWNPENWYAFAFYDYYLNPVYEVKVDGVPLLKIWKNDRKYLKREIGEGEPLKIAGLKVIGGKLDVDVGRQVYLTRIEIKHDNVNCNQQKGGFIKISTDGKAWRQLPETIDYPQIPVKWLRKNEKTFVYLLLPQKARFVHLDTQMTDSCLLKDPVVELLGTGI